MVVAEEVSEAIRMGWNTIYQDARRLGLFKDYLEGRQLRVRIPAGVDPNMRELVSKATTNLMRLAVDVPARMAFVEGFWRVAPDGSDVDLNPEEWAAWHESSFQATQTAVFRTSLTYGRAYVMVDPEDGRLRLLPTAQTVAFFEDPVNDRVPLFAVTVRKYPTGRREIIYLDETRMVRVPVGEAGPAFDMAWLDADEVYTLEHNLGACPVVYFPCQIDDEGRATGMVEPLIPAQDRVNQTAFDLLVTQSYGAFAVRWAAGLAGDPALDENGEVVKDANGHTVFKPMDISQMRMLLAEAPDAKFGTLQGTPIDGFVVALDNAIRAFAVAANIPPHSLLGSMNNLSGETIEAAMGQTRRFTHMLKISWGESVIQMMGLVRKVRGLPEIPGANYQVRWAEMSDQSIAQIVDALGKAASNLGVPGRGLWAKIPGVTDADLSKWDALASEQAEAELFAPASAARSASAERVTLGLFGERVEGGDGDGGASGTDSRFTP